MAEAHDEILWEKAKELYAGGKSYREVSEATGISQSTLRKEGAKENWAGLRNKVGTNAKGQRQKKPSETVADWVRVKNQYVTTEISQRELARRYGLNPGTVARKCKSEKWVEARREWQAKCGQRLAKDAENKAVERLNRIYKFGDTIMDVMERKLKEAYGTDEEIGEASLFTGLAGKVKKLQDLAPKEEKIEDNNGVRFTVNFDKCTATDVLKELESKEAAENA